MRCLCALAIVAGVGGLAEAATKLCIQPTKVTTISVPPDPRFVIVNDEEAKASPVTATRRGYGSQARQRAGDEIYSQTVVAIDEYWAERTVHAKPGQAFVGGLSSSCVLERYLVSRRRSSATT